LFYPVYVLREKGCYTSQVLT